jgi:hypothetical protein
MILRHVVVFGWLYGATWPSHGLPRGTLLLVVGLKFMESVGIEPQTSPPVQTFAKSALPTYHIVLLVKYMVLNIFKFKLFNSWRGGSGWGLAPTPNRVYHII